MSQNKQGTGGDPSTMHPIFGQIMGMLNRQGQPQPKMIPGQDNTLLSGGAPVNSAMRTQQQFGTADPFGGNSHAMFQLMKYYGGGNPGMSMGPSAFGPPGGNPMAGSGGGVAAFNAPDWVERK